MSREQAHGSVSGGIFYPSGHFPACPPRFISTTLKLRSLLRSLEKDFVSQSLFIALVQNTAWLLAMAVLFELAVGRQSLVRRPLRQLIVGVILGVFCMGLIHTSFCLEGGIIFDTRSVLLSISGLFFGPLPTLVAMLITAAFRLFKGGVGAWTGVAVTVATGVIGILWGRFRRGRLQDIRARELYALGLVAHVVMLALMLTLPWDHAQHVLHDISLPVMLIYPVAATALGLLLANRLRREQIAAELAASEERLRLAARMGAFELDLQTRRLTWSRKHEELWGFKPGEFDGSFAAFAARVHPDDLPGILADMERCQKAHAPYAGEFRVIWPDGSIHWITGLGQYFYDPAGTPLRVRGAAMEVTTLKQVETLRRENEERFHNLILRSPVPTGLVESDGTVSLINQRGTQLFGYTVADIPTIHDWWRRAFPDESYRQEAMATWNAALAQAIRENRVVEPREFTITAKDGSRHVVEVSGLSVPGGSLMATFIDVTDRKRAEEALREAGAYHRRLIEASLDPLVTIGPDGRITDANAATETVTGRGRQDLIGTDFADYFLEPERARAGYRQVLAEGQVRDYPLTIRHVSGRTTDVLYNASIYLNAAGQVQGVFAAARDMTERNKADQAVRESEEKFAAAFHASPNLMAITRLADGSIVDINESYSRLLGYSREESLARTTAALSIWANPADRNIFVAKLRESGRVANFETILRRKDGSEVAVLDSAQIISLRGELYILSVAYDINERKKVEEALRDSEVRFRTLVDGAPEGIFVQADGRFLFVNPAMARLLGAGQPADLVGRDMLTLIAPEFHAAVRDRIQGQLETGTAAPPMEQVYLRLDGNRVPVETTAVSVRFGNRDAHLVFVRDISERKRIELEKQSLQAQLAQVQKMDSVGRLAGGVAHDFNNMLGVILGHADLALEKLTPDRPCYNSLQEIRKAAMRSGDLTRQLLAFARKQTVAPRVLDLNETIEGMLKMLRRLIGENIELAWHPGQIPAHVKIDPSQIDQILANLCVNARDAINGTGRITIETGPAAFDADFCAAHPGYLPGDYVMLAVSDNGCGMDSETPLRLFEPFFTTKEVGKGTGLGLATVYGIVKQNNGFITVYSEPGLGSTFTIHLPRHAPAQAADPATPAPPARGTETILLVEDELALLTMTRLMLEQFGYRVLPAATPSEALRLAAQNAGQIHLLMTDVVMPEMNGRELAKALLVDNPGLKRLFMSGYTADVIAHHGVLDPGVHFLPKPFTPAELAAKIREALAPGTAAC